MIAYPRNRMTAWLGLFAMWLIVFAPIVSQSLASRDRDAPVAAICSADVRGDAGIHVLPDHFAACGYCNLLAHHVPAPAPVLPPLLAAARYGVAQLFASSTFVQREVFPAGRPRDSPRLA